MCSSRPWPSNELRPAVRCAGLTGDAARVEDRVNAPLLLGSLQSNCQEPLDTRPLLVN